MPLYGPSWPAEPSGSGKFGTPCDRMHCANGTVNVPTEPPWPPLAPVPPLLPEADVGTLSTVGVAAGDDAVPGCAGAIAPFEVAHEAASDATRTTPATTAGHFHRAVDPIG